MDHIKAFSIKAITSLVINYVLLGLVFNYSFPNILILTILLGVISYILGDLYILPRSNNFLASSADFTLAFLVSWFFLSTITYNDGTAFTASLFTALGLTIFELFFHKYMATNIYDNHEPDPQVSNLIYQAETAEEISPLHTNYKKVKRKKDSE